MNQRILGCTSLKVSELCLGTMNFGWRTDEPTSLAILDAYRACGGNFIQAMGLYPTAHYAAVSTSASEALVGHWWRSRNIPRRELVLATRASWGQLPDESPARLISRLNACCDESLDRFATDYLDLFICDDRARSASMEEVRDAFDVLVRSGRVRYLAFADVQAWRAADTIHQGPKRNHCRIDALQADYSLMNRVGFETELMDLCLEQRLGFLARSPMAGGLLTRRDPAGLVLGRSRFRWLTDRYGETSRSVIMRATADLAAQREITPAQLALAWVLHNPAVTSAVVGVNSTMQLQELVAAAAVELCPGELVRLSRASRAQRVTLRATRQVPRHRVGPARGR